MSQSLRFFYSINSYRSSFDESCSILPGKNSVNQNGNTNSPKHNINGQKTSIIMNKNVTTMNLLSGDSTNGSSPILIKNSGTLTRGPSEQGLFGMRNGRAHTYCTPRKSSSINESISSGVIFFYSKQQAY